jgi:hypothetical protein
MTGRALAVAGTALFALAAWLPWREFIGSGVVYGPGQPPADLYFSPGRGSTLPLLDRVIAPSNLLFAWSVLAVLGILLAPLLWQRGGAFVTRLSFALLVLWALVTSIISVAEVVTLASGSVPQVCQNSCRVSDTGQGGVAFGAWIALFALLLTWAGVVLVARAELSARGAPKRAARRLDESQPFWVGTSLATGGIMVWALGYIVMPWGSVNCKGVPLVLGTCTGVSGSSAVQAGIQSATMIVDPLAAQFAPALLLIGGGALLISGFWMRVTAPALRGWGLLWSLAALGIAILGYNGIGAIIADPTPFQLPNGTWQGAAGLWVAFLGIALVLVGLVRLWFSAFGHRRALARSGS